MPIKQEDEIDLILLLKTIWDGKWKIAATTMLTLISCVIFNFYNPNSFQITTAFSTNNQNIFLNFKNVNDILIESLDINTFHLEPYSFNGKTIYEIFVNEFNDYIEMTSVLQKNDFVANKIKDLNDLQKQKALMNFAKKFRILKPQTIESDSKILFNWHDVNEGFLLFKSALNLTLLNVRDKILNDINSLASSLDYQNQRKINSLNIKLQSIKETYDLKIAKKKIFLKEHLAIAKELGIKDFQNLSFDVELVSKISKKDELNYPYYLRGYKAIQKELDLIDYRSKTENNLMAAGYIEIKEELIQFENDVRPNNLRNAANKISNTDISRWINFNFELAKIKNLNKPNLYIIFSIFLGLFIGVVYIFFINAINKKKN